MLRRVNLNTTSFDHLRVLQAQQVLVLHFELNMPLVFRTLFDCEWFSLQRL